MYSTGQPFRKPTGHNGATRPNEPNRTNQRASNNAGSSPEAATNLDAKLEHLLAQATTMLEEPNRDLEALLSGYRSEFVPKGVHEQMLVRELAVADFRIQQITRIETGLLWLQVNDIYSFLNKPGVDPSGEIDPAAGTKPAPEISKASADLRTLLMGAAYLHHPKLFALLIRCQNTARRDYFRALKQLEAVRTGKAGYLPAKAESARAKSTGQEPAPQARAASAGAKNEVNETNPTQTAAAVQPHPRSLAVEAYTSPTPKPANPYAPSNVT